MNGKEGSSFSSSSPSLRLNSKMPTLNLPPRSSMEAMFSGGMSPGPMTMVSSFFAENDPESDFRSFSQLLAGGMPVEKEIGGGGGRNGLDFRLHGNRPTGLVVTEPGVLTIPPGLTPASASLLHSPTFFASSQDGMSSQQVLAQIVSQAVQTQTQNHMDAEYRTFSAPQPPPQLHVQATKQQYQPFSVPNGNNVLKEQYQPFSVPNGNNVLKEQHQPFSVPNGNNVLKEQHQPFSVPNGNNVLKDSGDVSPADQRSQPFSFNVDKPADDGYNWRKYGQKQVKGSECPRSYYKCTIHNCPVKKKVECSLEGHVTEIIYKGEHNHAPPQTSKRAKETGSDLGVTGIFDRQVENGPSNSVSINHQNSSHVTGLSDSEEVGDAVSKGQGRDDDEPESKRRNIEIQAAEPAVSHRSVTEARIIVQTTSEVDLLDDGYRWRKYGQKVVKGNQNPRSYYKCTNAGCKVRKQVERAAKDPKAVVTTYEGKHNHEVPAAKHSSHNTANNSGSQLSPPNAVPFWRPDHGNNGQQPVGLLRFKDEQFT